MKRETEYWIKAAEDDLNVIREIIDNQSLTNMIAFHSQQAIEKSIKAVLAEKENNVPRLHNIIALEGKIATYLKLNFDQEIFAQINDLYIDSRYPTDVGLLPDGKPSKEIANIFFETAIKIFKEITGYLSK